MKVLTIVGARPQFIKAAPVSRRIREYGEEVILHSGQHYDAALSDVFFDELGLPAPDIQLITGPGSHAQQTAAMLPGIEEAVLSTNPDWVIVYGDTNTTLAGALAAAKVQVPIAHVEAGARSLNRSMPEELNRVVVDHLSDLLFAPTESSMTHLRREGLEDRAYLVGDVMMDSLHDVLPLLSPDRVRALGVVDRFYLTTLHRAGLVDDRGRLRDALDLLSLLDAQVLFPVHPRTRLSIERFGLGLPDNVVDTEPLGYLDLLSAARDAKAVVTDSGGLQKDAIALGTKVILMRTETELTETLVGGWNQVVGTDRAAFLGALDTDPSEPPPTFLAPGASDAVVSVLVQRAASRPGG